MIKHETVNSIIGVLGLVIASITAFHQFVPPNDNLDIEVVPVPSNKTLNQYMDFQDGQSDDVLKISGPFFWKFTAYNSLDRTVTIKEIETKLLSDTGGLIYYSDLAVGTFDRDLKPLSLPISIEAREAKVIMLALNIPIKNQESCVVSQSTIREVERCYYSHGRDLFGNEVILLSDGVVQWGDIPKSPSFLSTLITGDNSEFHKTLSYYPFKP